MQQPKKLVPPILELKYKTFNNILSYFTYMYVQGYIYMFIYKKGVEKVCLQL